jgi:hypothetical protein
MRDPVQQAGAGLMLVPMTAAVRRPATVLRPAALRPAVLRPAVLRPAVLRTTTVLMPVALMNMSVAGGVPARPGGAGAGWRLHPVSMPATAHCSISTTTPGAQLRELRNCR